MVQGLVFEIKRFAVHDGPGIRTTVFFKGCPLRCAWCHNPEGISFKPEIALLDRKCEACGACFAACPKGLHGISPGAQASASPSPADTRVNFHATPSSGPRSDSAVSSYPDSAACTYPDSAASSCSDSAVSSCSDSAVSSCSDSAVSSCSDFAASSYPDFAASSYPDFAVNPYPDSATSPLPDSVGVHIIDRSRCDVCGVCVRACLPQALKLFGALYTPDELFRIVSADMDFYKQSGGGVTCSGGEALAQADFAAVFLRLCKEAGIHTAVDTAGHAPWSAFEAVLPYTDLFLYDIKHMDPARHLALTGADNRLILENLRALSSRGKPVEIRLLVVPGYNDDEENLRLSAEYLKGIHSLTLIRPLPYHALSGSKYASIGGEYHFIAATGHELEAAERVARYFERSGFTVAYPV